MTTTNYILLPKTLDIAALTSQVKLPKRLNDYLVVINMLHIKKYYDRRLERHCWIPLSRNTIRRYVHPRYQTTVVNDLKTLGVIECNEKYSKIHHLSKEYRLREDLRTFKYQKYPIPMKIITKLSEHNNMEWINSDPTRKLMFHHLQQTTIDTKKAMKYAERWMGDEEKYYHAQYTIMCLTKGDEDFYFKKGQSVDRIFTPITNLKKELRQFITVGGYEMGQVDMINSQPTFFALWLQRTPKIPIEERKRFLDLALSGEFYEYFNQDGETREVVKHGVLANILFGKKKQLLGCKYGMILQDDFPSIYSFLIEQKEANHKLIAHDLQNMEARFIFHTVGVLFATYGEHIPYLTIHDSIVCPVMMLDYTKRTMVSEFQSLFDIINTNFKIETFNPTTITQ